MTIGSLDGSPSLVYWPAVILSFVFGLLSPELKLIITVLILFAFAISRKGDLDLSFPKYSWLLLCIVLLGLISGLLNDQIRLFGLFSFLRDVTYFICPFLVWIMGCAMGRSLRDGNRLWTTLFAMSISSAASMIIFGLYKNGLNISVGSFKANEMIIFAPLLMIVPPQEWSWRSQNIKTARLLLLFDVVAIVLSLSRTTMVCLIVILTVMSFRSLVQMAKIMGLGMMLAVALLGLISFLPSETSQLFFSKVDNTFNEISSERVYWRDVDVVQNWRGYEKFIAKKAISNSDSHIQLFGMGDGYQLDMEGYGYLVGVSGRTIPFLHNGYYTLLIKTGIAGVFLFVLFLLLSFLNQISLLKLHPTYEGRLSIGLLSCIAICTYVIGGFFSPDSLHFFTIPLAIFFGRELHIENRDSTVQNN